MTNKHDFSTFVTIIYTITTNPIIPRIDYLNFKVFRKMDECISSMNFNS